MIVDERLVTYINSLDQGNTARLDEIESQALADYVPIIRKEMQSFLKLLLAIKKPMRILEVGTAVGFSAILMAEYDPEACEITTIENYEKRIPIAKENFKTCKVDDVITTLKGSALELLEGLPKDFVIDLAFVDANKSEYIKYYEIIDKHLKVGGIIACDNVLSHEAKCKPFIDAINANPNYENVILPLPAGLSLARKIK